MIGQIRRREFITLVGAAAWPLAAGARQSRMPVIGYLGGGSLGAAAHIMTVFRQSLAEAGYVESRNMVIEVAKALGLDVPPALLARADEVIE
jgi:putative ABC transport system substrate-binding protein